MYESHYLWIMYFFIKNEVLIRESKIIHWESKIIHTPTYNPQLPRTIHHSKDKRSTGIKNSDAKLNNSRDDVLLRLIPNTTKVLDYYYYIVTTTTTMIVVSVYCFACSVYYFACLY